jgi:hypothetical protein
MRLKKEMQNQMQYDTRGYSCSEVVDDTPEPSWKILQFRNPEWLGNVKDPKQYEARN